MDIVILNVLFVLLILSFIAIILIKTRKIAKQFEKLYDQMNNLETLINQINK